jgi:hypothetical protein
VRYLTDRSREDAAANEKIARIMKMADEAVKENIARNKRRLEQ